MSRSEQQQGDAWQQDRVLTMLDPECGLARLRAKRHRDGRDLKIVITQRDSETGGGKTTLAVYLALSWDPDWDGREQGTVHADEFLETYPKLSPHSALVMDEAEELDSRRSMATENVQFSHSWMKMRTRQIDSILTMPTTSALDKRLLELADVRINVVKRGEANVYRVKVGDHDRNSEPEQWFMHEMVWPDMTPHPEYKRLDAQKQADIDAGPDTGEDEADLSPKDIASQIREDERVQTFIREVNGSQRYIDASRIVAEYEVSAADAKAAKSLLLDEVDDDVM